MTEHMCKFESDGGPCVICGKTVSKKLMTNTTNAETPNQALDWEMPKSIAYSAFIELEHSRNALKSENERLKSQVEGMRLRDNDYFKLNEEHIRLKEQLEKWKEVAIELVQQVTRTGPAIRTDSERKALGNFQDLIKSEQLKKESES